MLSSHGSQHSWMGSLEMGSWAQMCLFPFLISKFSQEMKGMFALLSVCHKRWVFIKTLKYFSGRVICRRSQKQLTQPGVCKCFLPVFVCPGSCTNIVCRVPGEAGIAYPRILGLGDCCLQPGYFAVRHHWGGRWVNLSLDTKSVERRRMLQLRVAERFFFFFLEKSSRKERALKCSPLRAELPRGAGLAVGNKTKKENETMEF